MTMGRAPAAATALALLAGAAGAAGPARPVVIGKAGNDLDACLSTGEVTGLNPAGDNFLAVRAAPAVGARMIGRLGPRHMVHMCDDTPDGQWLGIVYSDDPRGETVCEVGSPVARPQPYRGPCRSGWVAARHILLVAG
jgi:hypothetical protein